MLHYWAALTKYHRLGDLNNRDLFLPGLEPENPRSRNQQDQCLMRAVSLGYRQLPSLCVFTRALLCVCTPRDSSLLSLLLIKSPTLMTSFNCLPKSPTSKYNHTLRVRVSTYEFEEHNLVHNSSIIALISMYYNVLFSCLSPPLASEFLRNTRSL